MQLFGVVDGIARDLDDQITLGHKGLAAQARVGFQTPGTVEQVFLGFFHLVERVEAFTHHHMAGGASGAHVAGVFDVDVVVQQGFADAGARRRGDFCTVGAVFGVGQDFDDGHRCL